MEDNYQVDDSLATWLQTEQMYLRVFGAALMVTAILGLLFGILHNPNNETAVTIANIAFSIGLGIAAIAALYSSTKVEYLEKTIKGYLEQGNSTAYVYAGVQIVVGLLFLLEASSRGLMVMLLLALTMLASGGFFIWRAQQIGKYQD